MTSKYQTYPEYKDSGVKWLGLIPVEWELWKLNHAFDEIGSGTTPPSGSDEWYGGEIPWVTTGELRETTIVSTTKNITLETTRKFPTLRKYPIGSIAIAMYGATIGRLGILGIEATTNQACCVLTKSDVVNNKYLYYWLQAFRKDIVNLASGGGQPNINQEVVASLKVSSPDLFCQNKIANFLDHETAKIDTLIEKQQQLIKLLKEKRQAVISHAVTKGLNPDAPMRDSGVEWLGEVPEHWVATRLKYMKSDDSNSFVDGPFGSNLKSEHFIDEGDVYVIESNFATTGLIDTKGLKKISKSHFEIIKRSSTKGGDIIIAKIGARYGSSSILPDLDKDAVVSGNSLKLTVNDELLDVEYANELLRVLKENDAMDDGVNITAQPALSLGGLNNLPFLKLPLDEQIEIMLYVNRMKTTFDDLILNAETFIRLAHERRTALISAAVTGKIDVRDWQAPEPSFSEAKEAVA